MGAGDFKITEGKALVFGGVGLLAWSFFQKDPATKLIMRAGGSLAILAGIISGDIGIAQNVGSSVSDFFGGIFGQKKPESEPISDDPATQLERGGGGLTVTGKIVSPLNGGEVDISPISRSYKVECRIVNNGRASARVRASVYGTETHWWSSSQVSGDLGEFNVGAGRSVLRSVEIPTTSLIGALPPPTVELTLVIDGLPADSISYKIE